MEARIAACRGCLFGLAVGDAMGYAVDDNSWEEICQEYGPAGLLGYDLRNDSAQVTSYTQIAAYVTNGLLIGLSRNRREYLRCITLALREWGKRQHFPRDPDKSNCWISQVPQLRRRHLRDARMLDAMRFDALGTPEKPINSANTPGAILAGAAIGLFFDSRRLEPAQIGDMAVQTVAMTHGDPEAFLSAAILAYTIAGILQEPGQPLEEQFSHAAQAVDMQFREQFPQAAQLAAKIQTTVSLAKSRESMHQEAMEQLRCTTAGECLAGAVYACLTHSEDFDGAMVTAVNHSGRSSAVGAITGAVLGAKLTEGALPDFYLESLEAVDALQVLADDLAQGSPATGLFDDDWDQKYVQGLPLENYSEYL